MAHPLDTAAVRDWCTRAREALGSGRARIDAINVFPVADGDTGTNLCRTLDAAGGALDPARSGPAGPALRELARGALLGACGNSGTILAQLLHGLAAAYEEREAAGGPGAAGGGRLLAHALGRAADAAYAAVARPVEGTMLTVARAAAERAAATVHAATAHAGSGDGAVPDAASVARAAHDGAREALTATTGQLDALRSAGVVDAGGSGLVLVLGALADALARAPRPERADPPRVPGPRNGAPGGRNGAAPDRSPAPARAGGPGLAPAGEAPPASARADGPGLAPAGEPPPAAAPADGPGLAPAGEPAYEVMFLLDADDAAVAVLRDRLGELGDSVVVGGGDGLWSVHVHAADAGAAVEAGLAAGRPHRVRISHLGTGTGTDTRDATACAPAPGTPRGRAVVAVVPGDGLAGLCAESGATVLRTEPAGPAGAEAVPRGPGPEELLAAVRATGAAEVVLLPNDPALHRRAREVAEEARVPRPGGTFPPVHVAVVPTRAAVQGLAALAVHEPERRFEDDVVAMTAAAGATRHGEIAVAARRAWTTAGVCQAGDVLGLVDGDVAVIGTDVQDTAARLLERMLAAGGELVTLVLGADAPEGLAPRLEEQVRRGHLAVDTVVYDGRQTSSLLLVGVE